MDSSDQVVFVLQVALAVGPISLYFLALGLVNSQARPCLISARADFTLLAIAFVPVIVWPAVALVGAGRYAMAIGVVAGVAGLFYAMLPRRDGGWVIYNISDGQWRQVLQRVCRRQDWSMCSAGPPEGEPAVRIEPAGLVLMQHTLPWLRNVTIRFDGDGVHAGGSSVRQQEFMDAITAELGREAMLPSATGASLVVVGGTLLGLPMWYLFHHMDAIVDIVRQIFFA